MICNFSNFQHGAHHDECTSDMMGGIMGGIQHNGGVIGGVPIT